MKNRKPNKFVRKLWKDWWKAAFFIIFVIIAVKSSLADKPVAALMADAVIEKIKAAK